MHLDYSFRCKVAVAVVNEMPTDRLNGRLVFVTGGLNSYGQDTEDEIV